MSLRDRPIKKKLVMIIMLTTLVALVVTGVGIVMTDTLLFRDFLGRDLSTLARIIADNSTAAIAFNDPDTAQETLGSLRERSHVVGSCLYRADGSLLARYSRSANFDCPPPVQRDEVRLSGAELIVSQGILLEGKRTGTLMLRYDLGEILDRVKLYGGLVFAVILGSSFLAYLLSARLREVIANPISRLVHASTSVAETGDYSVRAQRVSSDELGVLTDRFNEMLEGIQTRENHLKRALADVERERERFHFMAESMPQKIFTARPDGQIDYLNQQWVEFSGMPLAGINQMGWRILLHPDDVEENGRAWEKSLGSGEPFRCEHRFRRADGEYRWHLTRAEAMRDESGRISMWIGSNTEIHEQREREEALRRANDDLQQFAYSASHDLQEPIRNVAIYSELVAERYRNVVDDEGRQFLGFLKEGGGRLAALVSDLLAYTRAGMAELGRESVDSGTTLQHSLANLTETIRDTGAQITWGSLPVVPIAEAHLQQLFQNLIGNALKYHGNDPPRIDIQAVDMGLEWRFAVSDHGIGIDPQFREQIFGVFKRLHHDRTYSGNGIGLAICQRVVERYGGRIWVESQAGQGATFYFTIPRHALAALSGAMESSAGGGQPA